MAAVTSLNTYAETVIVESRSGGLNYSAYSEVAGTWSSSSGKSTATGITAGIGCRFSNAGTPAFRVSPTLQAGSTYDVYITHTTAGNNCSPDIVIGVTVTGNDAGQTSLPETTIAFQAAQSPNAWALVGRFTVDGSTTTPTVTFTYSSGTLASTLGRYYADAVKFENVGDPCLQVPQLSVVNGPLAAGQTFVNVPGVDAAATAVWIYADGTKIGEKTSGITGGLNVVPTSALVAGQKITATQWKNGIESCDVNPATGQVVGGGANPTLRVALNIKENTALTGPIGANGGGTGDIFFLGSANRLGGYGTAPSGGTVITPSTNWQTLSFQVGVDPAWCWSATGNTALDGNYGVLDGLAFAINDLDSGPYAIYIDSLMNGSTMIEDFEAYTNATEAATFAKPAYSTITSPYLLAQPPGTFNPNASTVTNATSSDGTKSLFVNWQFRDTNIINWVRLVTLPSRGLTNPIVDLTQPITLKLLVLPVGQTPPPSTNIIIPVNILAAKSGGQITLNWSGSHTLQSSTNAHTGFTDVPGPVTSGPFSENLSTASRKFFRLKD